MVESRRSEDGAAPRRRLVTIVGPLLVGLLAGLYFFGLRPDDADDRLAALEERHVVGEAQRQRGHGERHHGERQVEEGHELPRAATARLRMW